MSNPWSYLQNSQSLSNLTKAGESSRVVLLFPGEKFEVYRVFWSRSIFLCNHISLSTVSLVRLDQWNVWPQYHQSVRVDIVSLKGCFYVWRLFVCVWLFVSYMFLFFCYCDSMFESRGREKENQEREGESLLDLHYYVMSCEAFIQKWFHRGQVQ